MSSDSSIKYISSICLDESKRLLLRQCVDGTGWVPDFTETVYQCRYVMTEPEPCPSSIPTIVRSFVQLNSQNCDTKSYTIS